MSKSYSDQRNHRRKVASTPKGLQEHQKREKKRKDQARLVKRANKRAQKLEGYGT